ncbi:hypothetical protein FBU30_003851 [Linnemannia zychae]|nr:hypothetical protein FBU30_003851 [Linnemannia zychae]
MAGQLLRRSLARKDYQRAFAIYSTLIACKASSEELLWKVGSEILSRNKQYEASCLKFLRMVFRESKTCKESVLIEIVLYQMRCGLINEARLTLEPHITEFPYRDNPQIQGYFGVIEFALYNMEMEQIKTDRRQSQQAPCGLLDELQDQDDRFDDIIDYANEDDLKFQQWHRQVQNRKLSAIKYLERALQLDNRNDGFLTYLVRLKCGRIEMSGWNSDSASESRKAAAREMKTYLKQFYNDNNCSMLALQLLAALENRKRRKTLELIVALNPAADSELYVRPLVSLMWDSLPIEQKDIVFRTGNIDRVLEIHTQFSLDTTEGANGIHSLMDNHKSKFQQQQSHQQESNGLTDTSRQLDPVYIRPILQLLLTRAEYNTMTSWEEQEIQKIALLYSPHSTRPTALDCILQLYYNYNYDRDY